MQFLTGCRVIFASLVFTFASGCTTNNFEKFYIDKLQGKSVKELPGVAVTTESPKLYTTADTAKEIPAMVANGFVLVGYSAFNAGPQDNGGAIRQADKVGAAVVILQSKYTHTVSGSVPYTVSNPHQTVITNTSGSIYGPSGYSSFSGTSISSVPGGYSTYQIPYTVNRSDYIATYWVKRKPPVFGAVVGPMPDDLRKSLGTNRGVLVTAIINGTPAFHADILTGDAILEIDGNRCDDPTGFINSVTKCAGKKVAIRLNRSGKEMSISVQLNEMPK